MIRHQWKTNCLAGITRLPRSSIAHQMRGHPVNNGDQLAVQNR